MIEVSHLTKNYGARRAVDDLSFSVPTGQIVGLVGPNGAGKSTTMNMLTGYLAPTSGTVSIEGHDILDDPIQARRCIGYLPEIPPLYQDMKVDEYLRFVAELRGIPRAQRAEEVATAASQAGVTDVIDRLIRNLSKGYRQRVGLAAALLGDPQVIILDEPTVGLSEVQTICDRVLIISGGKLVAQGTPEELASRLASRGMISATAQGGREAVLAAAAALPGLSDLRVTAEKGDEVSFTAVSTDGADHRAELSAALAAAGCPVLSLQSEQMSLEDVFLQLTESEPAGGEPAGGEAQQPAVEAAEEAGAAAPESGPAAAEAEPPAPDAEDGAGDEPGDSAGAGAPPASDDPPRPEEENGKEGD